MSLDVRLGLLHMVALSSLSFAACGGDAVAPPPAEVDAGNTDAAPRDAAIDVGAAIRFTDLGDGTVRDNANGAVWQQSFSPGSQDQAASIAYCAGLTLDGGGWRLPTKDELLSIVDRSFFPTIDPSYFPGTPMRSFWSSSPDAGSPSDGWSVNFSNGYAYGDTLTDTYPARCVR